MKNPKSKYSRHPKHPRNFRKQRLERDFDDEENEKDDLSSLDVVEITELEFDDIITQNISLLYERINTLRSILQNSFDLYTRKERHKRAGTRMSYYKNKEDGSLRFYSREIQAGFHNGSE